MMAELVIRDEQLAWRLLDIARRENRPVEAVLESLLETYIDTETMAEAPPGSLALLAQKAVEAGIRSGRPVDTASRSREILHNEYADYLKKRRKDEQPDSD
jgi:hypothetical protein